MGQLETLLAKGVPWPTVGRIILLLSPQALGLTIPMALLVGLLIGLGRLSTDRESVALLACGVSPYRLLRPVLMLAGVATAATLYVMVSAIPDANQKYREILFATLSKKVESDIKPRVFFQEFPELGPVSAQRSRSRPAGMERRHARQHVEARHGRDSHGEARPYRHGSGQAHGRAHPDRRRQVCDGRSGRIEHRPVQAGHYPPRPRLGLSAGGRRAPARHNGEDHRPAAERHRGQGGPERVTSQRDHGYPRQVLDSYSVRRVRDHRPGAGPARLAGRQAWRLCRRHRGHLRLLHRHVPGRVPGQGPPHPGRIRAVDSESAARTARDRGPRVEGQARRGPAALRAAHPATAAAGLDTPEGRGDTARLASISCRHS